MDLDDIVRDFTIGLCAADALQPQAISQRGTRTYQPGIGPHAENAAVRLILNQLPRSGWTAPVVQAVPYPVSRAKCDLGIGDPLEWVVEIKMARAFGDNGKLDDTYLKDLLSPYAADRSALMDARKLADSGFTCRKAVLIYGFDYPGRPLEDVLEVLDVLLARKCRVGSRVCSHFDALVHPVHSRGQVAAWEVLI